MHAQFKERILLIMRENSTGASPEVIAEQALSSLDLRDKNSIVALLFAMQCGWVSARRAADEIMTRFNAEVVEIDL